MKHRKLQVVHLFCLCSVFAFVCFVGIVTLFGTSKQVHVLLDFQTSSRSLGFPKVHVLWDFQTSTRDTLFAMMYYYRLGDPATYELRQHCGLHEDMPSILIKS